MTATSKPHLQLRAPFRHAALAAPLVWWRLLQLCLSRQGLSSAAAASPAEGGLAVEEGGGGRAPPPPEVRISHGRLLGAQRPNGVDVFLGVPFAEAPVGELRFAPPRDWSSAYPGGRLDASRFGARCPGAGGRGGEGASAIGGGGAGGGEGADGIEDEDCLFLNLFLPPHRRGLGATALDGAGAASDGAAAAGALGSGGAATLVFVHGGSFVSGAGDLYDGAELAASTGAVVVTLNYRLGALGFALLDGGAGGGRPQGNFGLLDQRSALRWLTREGSAFGIDLERLLLFGESAGAASVSLHTLLPESQGLFSGALMESGVAGCVSEAYARVCGRALAALLHCPLEGEAALRCLRRRPWQEVLGAQARLLAVPENGTQFDVECSFGSAVDGSNVPAPPEELLRRGAAKPVPAIVGVNHDEGAVTAYSDWKAPVAEAEFRRIVTTVMNSRGKRASAEDVASIVAAYVGGEASAAGLRSGMTLSADASNASFLADASSVSDLRPALGRLLGDSFFICRSRRFLQLRQKASAAPASFKYIFSQRAMEDPSPKEWGVYHSSELPFVFGPGETGSIISLPGLSPSEERLRGLIGRLWTAMATFGDPNSALPLKEAWPRYDAARDPHFELRGAAGSRSGAGFHKKECDAWDAVWDRQGQQWHAAAEEDDATLVVV